MTNNNVSDFSPDWSPIDSEIAFVSVKLTDMTSQIFIMDDRGNNRTCITNIAGEKIYVKWSKIGNKLSFLSDSNLYISDADGKNIIKIAGNIYTDWKSFSWSPNEDNIIFSSKNENGYDI